MGMLGKLTLSPEAADLYSRAEAARLSLDFEMAESLYLELANRFEKISWTGRRLRARACATFCHAFVILRTTGSLDEAAGVLAAAEKEFKANDDLANATRASGHRKYMLAALLAAEFDFEGAKDSCQAAAQHFRSVKGHFPEEDSSLEWCALEAEMESCISDLTYLALHRQFDDCKVPVAAAKKAFESAKALPIQPELRPFLESRYHFAMTLTPMIRGQFAIQEFRAEEANRHLHEALEPIQTALGILSAVTANDALKQLAALYDGTRSSCLAAIRHAEVLRVLTSGGLAEAVDLLREVASMYEAAAEAHARAGAQGNLGRRSSTGLRDQFSGLAKLICSKVDAEFLVIPDFSRIAAREHTRQALDGDYRELLSCFLAGAWKMSVVCAGGIIETFLSDLLGSRLDSIRSRWRNHQNATVAQLQGWRLADLIDRAEEAEIITPGNAYVLDSLRNWRNLIHSSVQQRTSVAITREHAVSAVRALRWFLANIR